MTKSIINDTHPPSQLKYWLALQHALPYQPILAHKLLKHYNNPKTLFTNALNHLPEKLRARLQSVNWKHIEQSLEWAMQDGHHLLTLNHPHYPQLLKETADPPPVLFVKGDPQLLRTQQLAMVGSRNPTHSGLELARQFAYSLSQAGLVITSGLAIGIDGASHRGALLANNPTIAVLGCGLNHIYPKRHEQLATEIEKNGALVSEFPLNAPPIKTHFPQRNRIISGLCLGTLVVEATPRSGSLITAKLAIEQCREVFAIPGSVNNPQARGCHLLIRQGAELIETTDDILQALGSLAACNEGYLKRCSPNQAKPPTSSELDVAHKKLLECIGFEATPIDQMVVRCGLSASIITSMLLSLELQGYVKASLTGYNRVK